MKQYRIELPNGMAVVLKASDVSEAEAKFREHYPQITNYTIES